MFITRNTDQSSKNVNIFINYSLIKVVLLKPKWLYISNTYNSWVYVDTDVYIGIVK